MNQSIMENHLKRDADSFLQTFIQGSKDLDYAHRLYERMDPLMGYFLLRFLRENSKAVGLGAQQRLLEYFKEYPEVAKFFKGKISDPMLEWFDDSYKMQEFKATDDFVHLIVDKFEG